MQNRLKDQTSPYLLQHADNPVDWYPWGQEAFDKAKQEDKPVFLSIGYSTCHWCHVMARESFEDPQIAEILNRHFVPVKVDKEERPDIDSIYMAVCQAFTGSGGWPTTVFLTPDQKPFFAGTYFPKTTRNGMIGLRELLVNIHKAWQSDRESLAKSAEEMVLALNSNRLDMGEVQPNQEVDLAGRGYALFEKIYDEENGGFGGAPKFPSPHNLLFLMQYYEKRKEKKALDMVLKTLLQMYKGGIFDHIGGGFCRYSTDEKFLVPHFEKMLYDNALLMMAYCKAFELTGELIYRDVAEKIAVYVLREMTDEKGGFYSAQDADSDGEEGKYYVFYPREITELLGAKLGSEFNQHYGITDEGNFNGRSIPNLLHKNASDRSFDNQIVQVYDYRKQRCRLHLDDKILTSWNGLMIAALCNLYRVTENKAYLYAAVDAQDFILCNLCEKDTLYVSYRNGRGDQKGFLDDYAFEIYGLLALYQATWEDTYLKKAVQFCEKVVEDFFDTDKGGFFLYGKDNEQLIAKPKDVYDGAVFSGNSAMAYNLVQLYFLTEEEKYRVLSEQQLYFIGVQAGKFLLGHSMFLIALSDYIDPPKKMIVVVKDKKDLKDLSCRIGLDTIVRVLDHPTKEYLLRNDRTTFYVCKGRSCQPPVNELEE